MQEVHFIKSAADDSSSSWDAIAISKLSGLNIPDSILGRKKNLLRADINDQWTTWFIEGIADPRRYINKDVYYPHLFKEVFEVIDLKFSMYTHPEKKDLSTAIAQILQKRIQKIKQSNQRIPTSAKTKRLLLDLSGTSPRCWVCGAAFSDISIENFLFQKKEKNLIPTFIDIFKPRGLNQRDLSIEIDHVVPFSAGGDEGDNLKLACGWCNRHKSALTSIYDVAGRPITAGENLLGLSTLPHPFWVVRLLATTQHCEHLSGCHKTNQTHELTVSPNTLSGGLNPTNLVITCYEHDSLRKIRWQPPHKVKKIWNKAI